MLILKKLFDWTIYTKNSTPRSGVISKESYASLTLVRNCYVVFELVQHSLHDLWQCLITKSYKLCVVVQHNFSKWWQAGSSGHSGSSPATDKITR